MFYNRNVQVLYEAIQWIKLKSFWKPEVEKDNFDYLVRASMGVSFEDKTYF